MRTVPIITQKTSFTLSFISIFTPTLSTTVFVGENELIAAQSTKPCHFYGNPDIYGPDVRTRFYLQYIAALLAVGMALSSRYDKASLSSHLPY